MSSYTNASVGANLADADYGARIDLVAEFFDTVLPSTGLRCAGLPANGVFAHSFGATNEWLASEVLQINADHVDAYFACATFKKPGSRKADNVEAVGSFWFDIDTQEGKPKEHYKDRKEALKAVLAFYAELDLPRPLLVSSGYGLHGYSPISEDMTPEAWSQTAVLFKKAMKVWGLRADPTRTADVASVLRPVGCHNYKNDAAKLVKVLLQPAPAISQAEFHLKLEAYLALKGELARRGAPGGTHLSTGPITKVRHDRADAEKVADHCGIMAEIRGTGGNVEEPLWYAGLGVIAFAADGPAKSQEWSKGHPEYSPAETARKIGQVLKLTGPTTCERLEDYRPEVCRGCRFRGKIKTPAVLGMPTRDLEEGPPAIRLEPPEAPAGDVALPHTLSAESAMAIVNQRYGYAHDWGGRGTFIRVDGAGQTHPCTKEDLVNAMANRFVLTEGGRVALFKYWYTHPQRREVRRVIYAPGQGSIDENGELIENLWRGLNRKARRGTCRLMLRHLFYVVCGGNRKHFLYLLAWMAHVIQRPDEAPGVVVVLCSLLEGTGKTTVGGWLHKMLGQHSLMLNNPTQLLTRFNAHVEDKSLIVVNEPSWAGDKDAEGKLKSIITDAFITIERKHGGVYQIRNNLHFMFTTNAEWAVPAGAGARRYFVLDVDPSKAGDRAYFDALYHEAENGGIEALLYVLQKFPLDQVDLRTPPITDALREQQERTLSPEAQWALDLADRGQGTHPAQFNQLVGTRVLYDDYVEYMKQRRRHPQVSGIFGKWLTRVGVPVQRTNTGSQRLMPSPDDFAALVRKAAGVHS